MGGSSVAEYALQAVSVSMQTFTVGFMIHRFHTRKAVFIRICLVQQALAWVSTALVTGGTVIADRLPHRWVDVFTPGALPIGPGDDALLDAYGVLNALQTLAFMWSASMLTAVSIYRFGLLRPIMAGVFAAPVLTRAALGVVAAVCAVCSAVRIAEALLPPMSLFSLSWLFYLGVTLLMEAASLAGSITALARWRAKKTKEGHQKYTISQRKSVAAGTTTSTDGKEIRATEENVRSLRILTLLLVLDLTFDLINVAITLSNNLYLRKRDPDLSAVVLRVGYVMGCCHLLTSALSTKVIGLFLN